LCKLALLEIIAQLEDIVGSMRLEMDQRARLRLAALLEQRIRDTNAPPD
jgi:hypothetical protein